MYFSFFSRRELKTPHHISPFHRAPGPCAGQLGLGRRAVPAALQRGRVERALAHTDRAVPSGSRINIPAERSVETARHRKQLEGVPTTRRERAIAHFRGVHSSERQIHTAELLTVRDEVWSAVALDAAALGGRGHSLLLRPAHSCCRRKSVCSSGYTAA